MTVDVIMNSLKYDDFLHGTYDFAIDCTFNEVYCIGHLRLDLSFAGNQWS